MCLARHKNESVSKITVGKNGKNITLHITPSFEGLIYNAMITIVNNNKTNTLFVDCANAFDPYVVLKIAESRLAAKAALNNTLISRPFTIYQLKQLLDSNIGLEMKARKSRLLVFFGLTQLFLDEDITVTERKAVLRSIVQSIKDIGKNGNRVVVYLDENPFSEYFERRLNG